MSCPICKEYQCSHGLVQQGLSYTNMYAVKCGKLEAELAELLPALRKCVDSIKDAQSRADRLLSQIQEGELSRDLTILEIGINSALIRQVNVAEKLLRDLGPVLKKYLGTTGVSE